MTIEMKYKKPYGLRYDCYFNNHSIQKNSLISLPDDGEIVFIERSVFLSKFWWLLAIFNLLCGFFGSFDDWKNESIKQKKMIVSYRNIISDKITIEVLNEGKSIYLDGVESFSIVDMKEEENEKIKKRIAIAQKMLIIFPLAVLAIIFIVLAICLL